jgi:hypothetical protein
VQHGLTPQLTVAPPNPPLHRGAAARPGLEVSPGATRGTSSALGPSMGRWPEAPKPKPGCVQRGLAPQLTVAPPNPPLHRGVVARPGLEVSPGATQGTSSALGPNMGLEVALPPLPPPLPPTLFT